MDDPFAEIAPTIVVKRNRHTPARGNFNRKGAEQGASLYDKRLLHMVSERPRATVLRHRFQKGIGFDMPLIDPTADDVFSRSEERRVGKEWVSTCRSRWSSYHYYKKKY